MARRTSTDLPWLDVEEAPRADLADTRKLHRKARIYRIWGWASFFLAPIALIGWVSSMGGTDPVVAASAQSSPGRLVASGSLESWLASDPAPLPGAQIVSWDGAVEVASRVVEGPGSGDGYTVSTESNRFTVAVPATRSADSDTGGADSEDSTDPETDPETDPAVPSTTSAPAGDPDSTETAQSADMVTQRWSAVYEVTVLVEIDSRGGAVAISLPSVVPVPVPADDGWEETTPQWAGLSSTSVTDPVETAVSRWATAYISGDPEELRLATGDPDVTNRYSPLIGPDAVTTEALAAGTSDSGKTAVVRVRFSPHWPGQPVVDGSSSRDVPAAPPFELDLLVENANTGSPVIVAWGPPGTGGDLTAYQNAVTGSRPDIEPTTTTAAATATTTTTTKPAGDN